MIRTWSTLALVSLLAGCTPAGRESVPIGPSKESSPVTALPPRLSSPPAVASPTVAPPSAPASIAVPAGALYVCVSEVGGVRKQTVIEFEPRVHSLCARHPEMGPCQYERNGCRRSGGRVYDARGMEITPATEAEYDRKVMRVRLRSN